MLFRQAPRDNIEDREWNNFPEYFTAYGRRTLKVLFVYTNVGHGGEPHYYAGVGYLSAYLKREGHRTALLNYCRPPERERFLADLERESPDLVAFSTVTVEWPMARRLAEWAGEAGAGPILVGGVHPTLAPEEVASCDAVDVLCRGEGEEATAELLDRLASGKSYRNVKNLWIRQKNGEWKRNDPRPLIADLDALPHPDREVFDYQRILDATCREAVVKAGRGCAYRCAYCSNHAMMDLYKGKGRFVKMRSPRNVVDEVRRMKERYAFRCVCFDDETFTALKPWVLGFCEEWRRSGLDIPFRVMAHARTADRETARALADAGCELVSLGLEAGDEKIRRKVLRKNVTDEQMLRAFRVYREAGIETRAYNMIGVPGEGEAEIRKTMAMNRRIFADYMQATIFTPYPATALYELCEREGYFIAGANYSYIDRRSGLRLPTIGTDRIGELYKEFEALMLDLRIERERAGYYDFLYKFDAARVEAGAPGFVGRRLARVGFEERMSLLCHPPSRLSYDVRIRPGTRLRFAVGTEPADWERKEGDGIVFRVEVAPRPFGRRRVVYERFLDPKRCPEERRWHGEEIDLSGIADRFDRLGRLGRRVVLAFSTSVEGRNDYCSAYWAGPRLFAP